MVLSNRWKEKKRLLNCCIPSRFVIFRNLFASSERDWMSNISRGEKGKSPSISFLEKPLRESESESSVSFPVLSPFIFSVDYFSTSSSYLMLF